MIHRRSVRHMEFLSGAVGIGLNILLFLGKWIAGTLSGSIAITADAFNNLSDAGSSIITLIGFRLSGQAPDPEHPFGLWKDGVYFGAAGLCCDPGYGI